jgi:hypothetical protein
MNLRVHILEGTDAGGGRWYACGRWARASSYVPYVGCARLTDEGHNVTCLACRRKYAKALLPIGEDK